jgi:hypothetical protein
MRLLLFLILVQGIFIADNVCTYYHTYTGTSYVNLILANYNRTNPIIAMELGPCIWYRYQYPCNEIGDLNYDGKTNYNDYLIWSSSGDAGLWYAATGVKIHLPGCSYLRNNIRPAPPGSQVNCIRCLALLMKGTL